MDWVKNNVKAAAALVAGVGTLQFVAGLLAEHHFDVLDKVVSFVTSVVL